MSFIVGILYKISDAMYSCPINPVMLYFPYVCIPCLLYLLFASSALCLPFVIYSLIYLSAIFDTIKPMLMSRFLADQPMFYMILY